MTFYGFCINIGDLNSDKGKRDIAFFLPKNLYNFWFFPISDLGEFFLGEINLQIVPLNEAMDNTNYKLKRMTPTDMSRIPMTLLRVKDSLKTRYERIGMQI
jgi:hypothetical protein